MTGRQMCEVISKWLKETSGQDVSPESIWNAFPTGELWHVAELYEQAVADGFTAGAK